MIEVSTDDVDLLAIARALVTRDAYPSVDALLASPLRAERLGTSAMRVLERMLARGTVRLLAQLGGARARRRPGHAGMVRVFDVRRPPALAFGPWTFELLRWLTTAPLGIRDGALTFERRPVTIGDQLVAYLALRLVAGQRLEHAVASAPGLACPLTWLSFPRLLARHGTTEPALDDLLASEDGCTVVECLELDLARRWSEPLHEGPALVAAAASRIVGAERVVVADFLDGLVRHDRWDLAQAIVGAGKRALAPGVTPRELAHRFAPRTRAEGSLRSRMEARHRSGALLVALGRIGKKREELGLVRFIDDDYDAAQALLEAWEELPREAIVRAESALSILTSLDPLEES